MNLLWFDDVRDATTSEAAAIYGANGVAIFPCNGKIPLTQHGCKDATTDAQQIREWWREHSIANIGWALPSSLFALDVDVDKGGAEALRALEQKHGPLPLTLRARTGRGGQHWIYRVPPGERVANRASVAGAGLDTRSDGGYIIVAPSLHPETRKPYRWDSVIQPVDASPWLMGLVRVPPARERKPYVPPERVVDGTFSLEWYRRRRYALATLAALAREVAAAPDGQRNDTLNRAWWRILQFRDVVPEDDARAELLAAAVAAGLHEKEARKVLR